MPTSLVLTHHATAIESDEHLYRCLVYIDFNMVRAGVVNQPIQWKHVGYREIQEPPKRYAVIDSAPSAPLGLAYLDLCNSTVWSRCDI